MNKFIVISAFAAFLVVVLAAQSIFIVDQRQQAIVLQFGQPKGEPREPGLNFKVPFIQTVRYFDRRVLSVDPAPEQVVISSRAVVHNKPAAPKKDENIEEGAQQNEAEKNDASLGEPVIQEVSGEPIIVDTFARYKIVDPLKFMKTMRTIRNANSRLENILNDATRTVLGKTTLSELLSEYRTEVMGEIKSRVNRKITQDELGIEIVDVRIVRADLTAELRTSTVRRMISELKKRATETRSKGEERALEIRSTAEKERTVLLAEASRDAEIIKGEGDKEAIRIYADAFNKDKEFYAFTRSMEAYKNTLANPETRMILGPDSDFFRYFQDLNAKR